MARYHDYSEQPTYQIDLSIAENPFGASPVVLERIRNLHMQDIATYKERISDGLLRDIATYANVPASHVMLTRGARDGLDVALRAYIQPGNTVLTTQPTFPYIEFATQQQRLTLHKLEWPPESQLDIDAVLKTAHAQSAKAVYLCNPNNPTGHTISVAALLDLAQRFQGVLIVAETNIEFDGESLAAHVGKQSNIILLRSFSKGFGLAGLRIGYTIAHEHSIQLMQRQQPPHIISNVALHAAHAALQDIEWMQRHVKATQKEAQFLIQELQARGYIVYPSKANCFVVRAPKRYASAALFIEHLRAHQANAVVGDYFGMPDYIRLAPRTRKTNQAFLHVLDTIDATI